MEGARLILLELLPLEAVEGIRLNAFAALATRETVDATLENDGAR